VFLYERGFINDDCFYNISIAYAIGKTLIFNFANPDFDDLKSMRRKRGGRLTTSFSSIKVNSSQQFNLL